MNGRRVGRRVRPHAGVRAGRAATAIRTVHHVDRGRRLGLAYGATDEFGFKAVENRVSIHDLHATMLYALGIDHTQLTYRYAGRDFRLTDVFGDVIKDVLV